MPGRADIVVCRGLSNEVFFQQSNGQFTGAASVSLPGFSNAADVEAVDVDQDGDLDLVTAYSGTPSGNTYVNDGVAISLNTGSGNFAAPVSYDMMEFPRQMEIGDLNGDGDPDLVTSSSIHDGSNWIGQLVVRLGGSGGTFGAATIYTVTGTAGNTHLNLADLDRNGTLDATIVESFGAKRVSIYLGSGTGTFGSATTVTLSSDTTCAAIGDIDGDGNKDLVVGGNNGVTFSLLGTGSGSFEPPTPIVNIWDLGDIELFDASGDGVLDLATSSWVNACVKLFRGDSTTTTVEAAGNAGSFSTLAAVTFSLLTSESARAAIDSLSEQFNRIATYTGKIGAILSRLDTAAQVALSTRENIDAAVARITDVDIGQETAELVRSKILEQAGAAVLASSNQAPRLALDLLANI